ncbi:MULTISPECIES: Nramp family divalent metal transporter [unclassified Pseudoclavibacter]|uniref:Nramp family divalent metal transporter n=1 Tax=unclassified Pseudoclavibacter TaxID=2615177 RepID=UPI001BAA461E|nr:Nramp family divalent metal transporter [Pseudoclavibacter sp. Marseille-Q4354]MBS3180499.1 Nramp family divalent metal transporter [Pseudoclavibacter sp. Marseille-Q4354]
MGDTRLHSTPGTGHARISTEAVRTIVESRRTRRRFWQQLALIGPAFVAGAWQFGPGNLTTAVQAGSSYQYALIWVIAVSTVLMIFLTDMSVRLGIKSPVSLIASIKDHLGKPLGVVAGVGVFLITLCFSVGNAVGSGLGLSMLVEGSSPVMWTAICTLGVAAVLFIRSIYNVIEKVLIGIVALMAICFVVSAFVVNPDWAEAGRGLIPTAPEGSWLLIVALVGTNFSINAAFYTSYGTKERGRTEEDYRDVTLVDTIPGIIAPGIMTGLVIVVAAGALGKTAETATSITGLAAIFEPLAGPVGGFIFALGFAGAAFSSMIPNAIAGGTMLSDAFGRGGSANTITARVTSGFILAFGLAVTLIFQTSPVELIVLAQALTILVAPILAALIIIMANRRSLMGEMRNKWWQNLFGIFGLVAVLALSVRLLMSFIGG